MSRNRRPGAAALLGVGVLALNLLLTGCSKSPAQSQSAAKAVLGAAEEVVRGAASGSDDVARSATLKKSLEDLAAVPADDLAKADQVRRDQVLQRLRTAMEAALRDDQAIAALRQQIAAEAGVSDERAVQSAASIVSADSVQPQAFLADLRASTVDALKSAACDAILKTIFPAGQPAQGAADPYSFTEDFPAKVTEELGKTWAIATVDGLLKNASGGVLLRWADWANSVRTDAAQVEAAVNHDPETYLQLASRPPVQRATVVYAQYCYAMPQRV